jgi:hypothetical protein
MAAASQQSLDDYGFFGPSYSFADNIPLPGELGVRQEPSVGAIIDSVAGINHYVDRIAFGGRTFFDKVDQQPMGIRFFLDTGMRCSNGASMSEYFDGVTKGDLLGSRVAEGLASAGLPGLKGLAPGMLENARDALDPRPIFAAVTATGYPVCQQVTCPVGDTNGNTANPTDPANPYILGAVEFVDGLPYQRRWVQAYDATNSPINITKDDFAATPKCYNADGTYMSPVGTSCGLTEVQPLMETGSGRFANCRVVQPPSLPPSLEGFSGGDNTVSVGAAAAVAVLGGIALWAMMRRG